MEFDKSSTGYRALADLSGSSSQMPRDLTSSGLCGILWDPAHKHTHTHKEKILILKNSLLQNRD